MESFYYGKVPAAQAGKVHEGRVIAHLERLTRTMPYIDVEDVTDTDQDYGNGTDVIIRVYDNGELLLYVPIDLKSYGPTRAVGCRVYGENCREVAYKIISAVEKARSRALKIKAETDTWRPWRVTIARYFV